MSKHPHGSQAPGPASEELVKRLRAAADDYSMRLQEIVESNDSASIAAAFATLLAASTASAMKDSERPKKVSLAFSRRFLPKRKRAVLV